MNSYRVYSDFFVAAIGTMALMLGFLPRIGTAIRFLIGTCELIYKYSISTLDKYGQDML